MDNKDETIQRQAQIIRDLEQTLERERADRRRERIDLRAPLSAFEALNPGEALLKKAREAEEAKEQRDYWKSIAQQLKNEILHAYTLSQEASESSQHLARGYLADLDQLASQNELSLIAAAFYWAANDLAAFTGKLREEQLTMLSNCSGTQDSEPVDAYLHPKLLLARTAVNWEASMNNRISANFADFTRNLADDIHFIAHDILVDLVKGETFSQSKNLQRLPLGWVQERNTHPRSHAIFGEGIEWAANYRYESKHRKLTQTAFCDLHDRKISERRLGTYIQWLEDLEQLARTSIETLKEMLKRAPEKL